MTAALPAGFLPVLTVHEISDVDSPWCLPPTTFTDLAQWLADHGYTTLTMTDLARHYTREHPATGPAVALTFDDGRSGVYRHARAVLAEHGMRATVYPVAGWARGVPLPRHEAYSTAMNLTELRALHDDGHEIGYHTATHTCLRTLTDTEIRHDITTSRDRLADDLGIGLRHFSYPYGHHDQRVEHLVNHHGEFDTVVTNTRGLQPDPRCHPRISLKKGLHAQNFPTLFTNESWRPGAPAPCTHTTPEPPEAR